MFSRRILLQAAVVTVMGALALGTPERASASGMNCPNISGCASYCPTGDDVYDICNDLLEPESECSATGAICGENSECEHRLICTYGPDR